MRRNVSPRRRKFPVRTTCTLLSFVVAIGAAIPALGDVFHLKNGGSVEGAVIEQTATSYKLRTIVGTITVPVDAVESVEKKPSIIEEYQKRLAEVTETPEEHVALAQWCDENEYTAGARTHFKRAVELDPNCEPARKALGYVRVGDAWVEGRSIADDAKPDPNENRSEKAEDDKPVVTAIQSQWTVQIREIRRNKLEGSNEDLIADGRRKILEITDPLAILPLIRVLSEGNLACRAALVEALSRFPQDEATMNLAALALLDRDMEVRDRALAELKRRDDPRVIPQFRRALLSDNDPLIRRAAIGLRGLGARSAVPDLIDSLTVQRNKRVEVSVRTYLHGLQGDFTGPTSVSYGGTTQIFHQPVMGFYGAAGPFVFVDREFQRRNVTVFRTEVLEALRSITGQSFGFDAAEWRRWYEEQQP